VGITAGHTTTNAAVTTIRIIFGIVLLLFAGILRPLRSGTPEGAGGELFIHANISFNSGIGMSRCKGASEFVKRLKDIIVSVVVLFKLFGACESFVSPI
jgi:hypothetical protein